MGRWTSYSRYSSKDSPWTLDGDPVFKGLDMLHDRGIVAPGYLARSENKRLRDGAASTRPGTTAPLDFNPLFENTISGSGIYSNPNGDEIMLVATENATYVWALQFGKDPVKISLFAGQSTGVKFIQFIQSFDKVILLRRPIGTDPVLVWDGDNTHTFDPMALVVPGLYQVPPQWNAEPFEDRLIYYNDYFSIVPGRDQLLVSDTLNFTAYDNFLGVFRVAAGESDMITRVMGYFKSALLVFKRNSIHLLQDFTVDFFSAQQRKLSAKLGSVGNKMPLLIGSRVMFLSQPGGFYFVDEVIQDQIATDPVPVSRPIQPIIDRINWLRADYWACSANLGDYSYFALPLDFKTGGNDSVVVRNNSTGEWESLDQWADPDFRIYALHTTYYDGQRRLFGLDYGAKKIYLMYTGLSDQIGNADVPVNDLIETRGYVCGDPGGYKRFERAVVGIRTLNPQIKVTALSDGLNEEKELANIIKNRLKFYTHGHKDFNPLTDDPNEPKREDYSTGVENFAGEDFEELPDGGITFLPSTPVDFFGEKQQSLERVQVRQNGRWCSIRIENTGGQCDVLGVGVEAIPITETIRAVA